MNASRGPRQDQLGLTLAHWVILLGALLWPVLWNGFPLVFPDTGTYIAAAEERFIPRDRPVYYSAFLWLTGRPMSPYGSVAVQAALAGWACLVAVRAVAPKASPTALVSVVAAAAVLTPLSLLASWMMPDLFGGVLALVVLSRVAFDHRLGRGQRLALDALLLLCLVVHSGNLLSGALFAVLAFGLSLLIVRRIPWRAVAEIGLVGVVAWVLAVVPNRVAYGKFTANMDAPAFLANRLVNDGLMQAYLEKACAAEPALLLCPHLAELRGLPYDGFLWGPEPAVVDRVGGRSGNDAALMELVRAAVVGQPHEALRSARRGLVQLLPATSPGENRAIDDVFRPNPPDQTVHRRIRLFYPDQVHRFEGSRQSAGRLHFERIEPIHKWLTYASYAALLALLALAIRRGDREAVLAIAVVFAMLVANAAVHSLLSGPIPRYQAKVAWIAVVLAGALALRAVATRAPLSGGPAGANRSKDDA